MNADQGASSQGVRAADRLLDVMEALASHVDGLSLTELARQTEIPKTTVLRYIMTLIDRGYVVRGPAVDTYRIPFSLQVMRPQQIVQLVAAVRPWMFSLRETFQATVNLGVLESNGVSYLEVASDTGAIRFNARTGARDPIHSTALGKAIAVQLREPEIRRIARLEGLPPRTATTITELAAFLRELQDVRRRGYARDRGENEEGGACLAVPLYGAPVPAALSLTAPVGRLTADAIDQVVAGLREAAEAVANTLTVRRG
ncbi:IclR family transcriptional regulator [Flindersiella endophytica]